MIITFGTSIPYYPSKLPQRSPYFGAAPSQRKASTKASDTQAALDKANAALRALGMHSELAFSPKQAARVVAVSQALHEAGFDLSNIYISNKYHRGWRRVTDGTTQMVSNIKEGSLAELLNAPEGSIIISLAPDSFWRRWLAPHSPLVRWSQNINLQFLISGPTFSSTHPAHVEIHEFIHALHANNLKKAGSSLSQLKKEVKLSKALWWKLGNKVSLYAGTNINEAIAEIGTGILAGRFKLSDLSPKLQQLWHDNWQGPELPFGLLKDVAR